jgi:hypothetical protein
MDTPSSWGCLCDDIETQELTRVKVWREIEACKAVLDNTLSDAANACFRVNSALAHIIRERERRTAKDVDATVIGNMTMGNVGMYLVYMYVRLLDSIDSVGISQEHSRT